MAEVLFDERFGCVEEEINKGAQTFIRVVGDFSGECGRGRCNDSVMI